MVELSSNELLLGEGQKPSADSVTIQLGKKKLSLTNLDKPFWPRLGLRKRDLLSYYLCVSEYLLPHLAGRAMVMKRYPNGAAGEFFFMKRAPRPRPAWIKTCRIKHASGNVIDFPLVADAADLLWMINLGCIDLNPWYARCSDTARPDFIHFDLDPVPKANFETVRETALIVIEKLTKLGMKPYAKTTGSRGIHLYVAIRRGPLQKEVWTVAKHIAMELSSANPKLITSEYRIAKRPAGRVLVDYNQNAWGRTLASVYSVRPTSKATVSMPVTLREIECGVSIDDFDIRNASKRLTKEGDLWKGLLSKTGRYKLDKLL